MISGRRIVFGCALALVVLIILSLITSPIWLESKTVFPIELLLLSCVGIVVLLLLVIFYVVRLVRRYRMHVPGTALGIQFLGVFTSVIISSLSLVYLYSFFSLSQSIDSWFDLQVGDAVKDVNLVDDLFIESLQEKLASDLHDYVERLGQTAELREISKLLFDVRSFGDFEEVTYYENLTSPTGIIASSGIDIESLVPQRPSESLVNRALAANVYEPVGEILESKGGSPGQLRVLFPVPIPGTEEKHYLQVMTTLRASSQSLLDRIGLVNIKYDRLAQEFVTFEYSLILTLSLVTLLALLFATWVSMAMTQKLVAPFRVLSEGTLAVAKGIYDQLPPTAVSDDLGVLFSSFNEMTKRIKTSQEQLRKSRLTAELQKNNLEIVLQHLSSGVLFIDHAARLININIAAEGILDVHANEVIDKTLSELEQTHRQMAPLFAEILKGTQQHQDELSDTVFVDSSDGRRVLAYSSTRLPVKLENVNRYVVVIEDITDLVQAQRSIAWGEVARRMAHEILNPLQPIRLAVDRIRMKTQLKLTTSDSQSLDLAFDAIYRQLDFMQIIVNEFRNYQSISVVNVSPVNLNALIREAVELYNQDDDPLEIALDLDPALPEFKADASQLVQVLNNLLINAKDAVASIQKPVVTIRTESDENSTITLTVLDNGPGFNPKLLGQLFEPYATTKKKGMGLGLVIVKRIVNGHNGKISASNRKSGGAKFTIQFDTRTTSIADGSISSLKQFQRDYDN